LENDANPNAINNSGETPLDYAGLCGTDECIDLLIKFGAKPTNLNLQNQ
jgi:ankyrin repeat protein